MAIREKRLSWLLSADEEKVGSQLSRELGDDGGSLVGYASSVYTETRAHKFRVITFYSSRFQPKVLCDCVAIIIQ